MICDKPTASWSLGQLASELPIRVLRGGGPSQPTPFTKLAKPVLNRGNW